MKDSLTDLLYCVEYLIDGVLHRNLIRPVDAANGLILESEYTGSGDDFVFLGAKLNGSLLEIPAECFVACFPWWKVTTDAFGGNGQKNYWYTDTAMSKAVAGESKDSRVLKRDQNTGEVTNAQWRQSLPKDVPKNRVIRG